MQATAPPRSSTRSGARLTGAGATALLATGTTWALALHTGDNRLYLLVATLTALLVVETVLGTWNIRNLRVLRSLPEDLHAGRPCTGALRLENHRRWMPARAVVVEDRTGLARASWAWLPPGAALEVPARWTFPQRGLVPAGALALGSRFPFGFVERFRVAAPGGEVLVFPELAEGPVSDGATSGGARRPEDAHPGGDSDFLGLRPYRAGDPPARIHWLSSARTGRPLTVIRGTETDEQVWVHLQAGPDREEEIRRAAAAVVYHVRRGRSVGLRVGERAWEPVPGETQRRRLLTVLALLPVRGGTP